MKNDFLNEPRPITLLVGEEGLRLYNEAFKQYIKDMKLSQINPKNIKGFIQAHFREVLDSFGELPKHIKEQAQWRLNKVRQASPECYDKDKCQHCGCQVSSKVFEDRGCSDNEKCYPKMMNEPEWELFKLTKNWELMILFGKENMFEKQLNNSFGCPICKDIGCTNDGFACYHCNPEEYKKQIK